MGRLKIAVVGAGISGLSAAYRLRECCPDAELAVFDRRNRPGGLIQTDLIDGFEVEQSVDNFITTVPYGLDLCRKVGLESEIVTTTPQHRQTFVVWKNRLCKLPDGFMMMAPTQWWPMAITPLLSPWGKIRSGLELFVPRKKTDDDESMEDFAVRRLGREAYDRLIEPLVSGVYAADMKKLSLLATLPRFREMEKEYGSLILAMLAARKNRKRHSEVQSGPRYNMFVTIRGGLGRLVHAVVNQLPANTLRLETEVVSLERLSDGWNLTWRKDGQTRTERFERLILATESHFGAKLLETAGLTRISSLLGGIEHTGTAIVTVAYRREQIRHKLDGMGAVVPAVEKSPILALSFSNEKYPHRAPEGYALLRIFSGGARNPEMVHLSDDALKKTLLENVSSILGISGSPIMTSLSRWPNTMPQYHLGHLERVAQIEKQVAEIPTLALAGNAFHGVGLPQCVHSGEEAAEKWA
ncbi:MAG: protoporphyrinogen oxidase [Planctomycetia bacterium]|nr:protoporphyrinogen oxidase [Planctomycetia bacterium]